MIRKPALASSRRAWVLAITIVVAFNTWVLFALVDGHQIVSGGLLSELAADTRPLHGLFRIGDAVTGSCVLLVAAAIRHQPWLRRALQVTGSSTIGDAILNLECSPAADATCNPPIDLFAQSWRLQAHTAMSALFVFGLLASLVVVRQTLGTRSLLTVQVMANVVLVVCDLSGVPHLTWLQAISVVLASLWFATLALRYWPRRPQWVRRPDTAPKQLPTT